MIFLHENPEYQKWIRTVGAEKELLPGLVEKDYWVTHTLWSLAQSQCDFWFKGGTSLSKAFGLVTRFSEDIDVRLEHPSLPEVSWTSERKGGVADRQQYFEALTRLIKVPGANVKLADKQDKLWRSADIYVEYPSLFEVRAPMLPFVKIEAGMARVAPFVERDISSFIHDALAAQGALADHKDNRPNRVRVVHPLVTLLEKLDAISKRYNRESFAPASFIRHYEDAARIIDALSGFAQLDQTPAALADEMLALKQIKQRPSEKDDAFVLSNSEKKASLLAEYAAVSHMFWGDRLSLDETNKHIRAWIRANLA